MSGENDVIVCRHCDTVFPEADENCPHCGTPVRGYTGPAAIIILGSILVASSLPKLGELFYYGIIGLLLIAVGVYVIYDKRDRISEARERRAQESLDHLM